MDITLDKKSKTEASIKVTLKEEDYQPKVDEKIKEYKKKINLKGFRPGKVPPHVIKKLYGKSLLVEVINELISEALPKYIQDNNLKIIGEPLPNHESQSNIDWDHQSEFEFVYDIGLIDEFEDPLNKALQIDKNLIKVGKEEVDETIENVKQQYGTQEHPETVEQGDIISGTLVQEANDINTDVNIDTKELTKTAANLFIGAEKEDVVTFDIKKVYKKNEDLANLLNKQEDEVKAIEGDCMLTITDITRNIPAEFNQELFDQVFGKDKVTDEESFRQKVEETIKESYNRESDNLLERDIRDKIVNEVEMELPEEFLKRWIVESQKDQEQEVKREDVESNFDQYRKDIKWNLITGKIAEDHNIKVEHEDVRQKAKEMLANQLGQSGLLEQLGDNLEGFVDNYLQSQDGENYKQISNQAQTEKVMNFIKEQITINEKEVSFEEFKSLAS